MHEYMKAALTQIKTSGLSAVQYRTARELLDRASHRGEVYLSIDEMLTIADTPSVGTMRNHLIALKKTGILRYHINEKLHKVWIDFLAWPAPSLQWPVESTGGRYA